MSLHVNVPMPTLTPPTEHTKHTHVHTHQTHIHVPVFGEGSGLAFRVEGSSGAEHGRGLQVTNDALDGCYGFIAGLCSHSSRLYGCHHIRHLKTERHRTSYIIIRTPRRSVLINEVS